MLSPVLGCSAQEGHGAPGAGPVETMRAMRGLEQLLQGKAEGAGPVQPPEETTERGTRCFEHLERGCQGGGARLCSVMPSNRTRGNGQKQGVPPVHEEEVLYCAGD